MLHSTPAGVMLSAGVGLRREGTIAARSREMSGLASRNLAMDANALLLGLSSLLPPASEAGPAGRSLPPLAIALDARSGPVPLAGRLPARNRSGCSRVRARRRPASPPTARNATAAATALDWLLAASPSSKNSSGSSSVSTLSTRSDRVLTPWLWCMAHGNSAATRGARSGTAASGGPCNRKCSATIATELTTSTFLAAWSASGDSRKEAAS
mmetsp:Transcript_9758/g.29358  ORF Transcript_9758/g.29358 Transcript_9758/m.29358 type:complete len:212 (+) Transcript_9758:175-810(+)